MSSSRRRLEQPEASGRAWGLGRWSAGGEEAADTQGDPAKEDDDLTRHERLGISDDPIYGPPNDENGGYNLTRMQTADVALLDRALATPCTPRTTLRNWSKARIILSTERSPEAQQYPDSTKSRRVRSFRQHVCGWTEH